MRKSVGIPLVLCMALLGVSVNAQMLYSISCQSEGYPIPMIQQAEIKAIGYPPIKLKNTSIDEMANALGDVFEFSPENFKGVRSITFDGNKRILHKNGKDFGAYYSQSRDITIGRTWIESDSTEIIIHELTHNKCWMKSRDISNESNCFKDGLA